VAEESIQQRVVLYDKSGDRHYDVISAFIKSMRGGDPDAALYWLACMVKAGEDPRFIARRIMISASEDVGNADPRALQVAVSAAQAVEMLGMPEGRIPLAQAVVYVATAPKSNASYMGVDSAMALIETGASLDVPMHLRDASYKSARKLGHGKGYDYPHSHPGAFVPQQYLPEGLKEQQFYSPTDYGYEKHIRERLRHWWGDRWK
jgi:putative ATPase